MSEAHVTEVAALADFRAALTEFAGEVRRGLTDIQLEVRRAMEWIAVDRPAHWRMESRRSGEALAHAKDELAHSRTYKTIGDYVPACIEEKKAVEKAKRRLEHAEEKLEIVRHWIMASRHAVDEFQGPVQQLMGMLDGDIPRAIFLLERMSIALENYATGTAPTAINWEELVRQMQTASVAQPVDSQEQSPEAKKQSADSHPAAAKSNTTKTAAP
ncbi:MAG TPA: hypothetical protein VGJ04_06690 [Pirellulales bacterium]|jgi:hypothetical protein